MCGIYGILSFTPAYRPQPSDLACMARVAVHRGPDDEGQYVDQRLALGMRRLSIIDVAGGRQPIANEDETIQVVCNGEIYNFQSLRRQLEREGHRFRTRSDAEVVVHLYEQYGDDCVQRLDGMFGFALWDARRCRLLIARDRLGIKPLYYRTDARRLIFGSEAKSILAVPGVPTELAPAAVEQYLALGYVPAPHSIFAGIHKLPPATLLIAENGGIELRPYWGLAMAPEEGRSDGEWAELVREHLEGAVVSQMVSDVPLGAFLSGGIDSSAVVASMAGASSRPVKTYSIGFETAGAGAYYNELPYARRIAERFGTEHREIIVKPDIAELLPTLLWHLDEPIADSAFITTFLVSRFAREDVAVILSGVGGDELFGGYRRYLGEYLRRHYLRLPQTLRRHVLQPLARSLPSDRHSALLNLARYSRSFILSSEQTFQERYRSYVQVFSNEQCRSLLRHTPRNGADALSLAFTAAGDGENLDSLFTVDCLTQLPDDLLMLTDKMSMATSIECRVPLLDQRLVELAARMPARLKVRGHRLKYILKEALSGLLPNDILHRPKRGFGAPLGAWFKGELEGLLGQVLSRDAVERRGLFRWSAIEETLALHRANREDHTDHLLALLNLELWSRIYLDGCAPADLSEQIKGEALH